MESSINFQWGKTGQRKSFFKWNLAKHQKLQQECSERAECFETWTVEVAWGTSYELKTVLKKNVSEIWEGFRNIFIYINWIIKNEHKTFHWQIFSLTVMWLKALPHLSIYVCVWGGGSYISVFIYLFFIQRPVIVQKQSNKATKQKHDLALEHLNICDFIHDFRQHAWTQFSTTINI